MATDRDRAKEVDELLKKIEPRFRSAFRTGLESLQESISLSQIEDAINAGDIARASELINELIVATAFIQFNREIQAAVQAGGDLAAGWARADKIVFGLNVTESNTARFISEYQANKIREMTADLQSHIGNMVLDAVNEGVNPRTAARRIRDGIGLTAKQEQAVRNFERLLREQDKAVLDRVLRDKRFDRTIARAFADKQPLTEAQIKKMTARYRERYIKHRAEVIARTESIRLLSVGQSEFWEQAITAGHVGREQLKRKWLPTYDGRTRESHITIPRLNPEGVGFDEPFKTTQGPLMYPGDPAAPASNSINCRCATITRIVA